MERDRVELVFARFAPEARVGAIERLEGGVSSLMALVEVASPDLPSRLVVRRLGEYAREHDPDSLRREHVVLQRALEAGVPAPPVVFADLEG
ncbi:MAG TPA: hypothetical protein PK095_21705, partial [Myxococcota bacterium]|nr:hypothetical protein [Myxococcota bacterium]